LEPITLNAIDKVFHILDQSPNENLNAAHQWLLARLG
jgi:hypothetical protein